MNVRLRERWKSKYTGTENELGLSVGINLLDLKKL
jgi:hypothetical protein